MALLLGLASWLPGAAAQAGEHILGIGANYWQTVDDIDFGEIDNSGLSTVVAYTYRPGGLIGFEFDVEYFGEGFAGTNRDVISPQAYVVVGRNFYVAAGIGTNYSSDLEDEFSDPYYAAKMGINFSLLPHLGLDVNANYRFDAWGDLDEVDTDTVFLGALLRFSF